jgi:hypothetical protein
VLLGAHARRAATSSSWPRSSPTPDGAVRIEWRPATLQRPCTVPTDVRLDVCKRSMRWVGLIAWERGYHARFTVLDGSVVDQLQAGRVL